ncbi:MAG TPA: glucosaminidase domain-containing protein [Ktedonobacteraceae bacterium]|nr:glucosaminidase domain-containing protein [Ktedonobacteraceae bacterium]
MASGNYSSGYLPQEPEQILIPPRASATRQLPVVTGQEESTTQSLPVTRAQRARSDNRSTKELSVTRTHTGERSTKGLSVTRIHSDDYSTKELSITKIHHYVDELREGPLTHLPRHLPWLRPFVICLVGVVILFFVLISAGVFQRPGDSSHLVYSPNAQSYPIQVGGSISAINTWQNSNGPISSLTPIPSHTGPYSVIGKPTLTADFMNRVLAAYNSPAAGKGQELYDLGVKYGIDPAFALAFFMHESTFGTAGMARTTLSLGNLRCIPSVPCNNGYAQFSSWEQGFEAWYKLIRNLYVAQWGLVSVDQIIPTYAPSSDHNNVNGYIAALKHSIDTWHAGVIQVT